MALRDDLELPLAVVLVQLGEAERGLDREVLGQVGAADLFAGLFVDQADEGVADHAEALLAVDGVVDGDDEDQLLDGRIELAQLDLDLLVVTGAGARLVVAGVQDRALEVAEVALLVEDHVAVVTALAGGGEQEAGSVQVEVLAVGAARVPAQAHDDLVQGGGLLGQVDVFALAELNGHVYLPLSFGVDCVFQTPGKTAGTPHI